MKDDFFKMAPSLILLMKEENHSPSQLELELLFQAGKSVSWAWKLEKEPKLWLTLTMDMAMKGEELSQVEPQWFSVSNSLICGLQSKIRLKKSLKWKNQLLSQAMNKLHNPLKKSKKNSMRQLSVTKLMINLFLLKKIKKLLLALLRFQNQICLVHKCQNQQNLNPKFKALQNQSH